MLNKDESLKVLQSYFKRNKIGKISDLFSLLKTTSRMSVFRRLRELHYLSSYSHTGMYYTLPEMASFDLDGLWRCDDIGFSQFGNLKETVFHFIEKSKAGKTHDELEKQLHIRVHNTLLDLVRSHKIARKQTNKGFVYFSVNTSQSKQQLLYREDLARGWQKEVLPDWVIIEVLVSIIHTSQGVRINMTAVVAQLTAKGLVITTEQVEQILNKFDLKKTPDSP